MTASLVCVESEPGGGVKPCGRSRGTKRHVKQPTAWGTYHPWQYQRRRGLACSHCSGLLDRAGQRYCKACHAAHMRLTRQHDAVNDSVPMRKAA